MISLIILDKYELDIKILIKDNAAELLKVAVEHKKEGEERIKARYSH